MSISLYQSSVPVFERALTALSGVLDKAATHAAARKFDPAIYLTTRFRPDMLAFVAQVQIACDQAKNGMARLAGAQPPRFDDKEASLDELNARIKATLAFLKSVDSKAVDASCDREIVFPIGPNKMKMKGADYLLHYMLPNFYFHLTAAYALLRYNGVEIGKRDFLGFIPGIAPA